MDLLPAKTTRPGEYITQVNPNDVLFGRGSGPNDHEGNIRFRELVGERKAEYMATNHRQTKAKIAREIVGSVLQKNGRFLKKVEAAEAKELGIAKGIEAWICVDEETIMEKAKQALRQQRDKSKPGGGLSPNSSPTPPARKTPAKVSSLSLDSYAQGHQYETAAAAEALRQSNPMHHVEVDLSDGYDHTAHLHPNPYEPIPIGSNAVFGANNSLGLDWRNYAQAAIMSQTQGLRSNNFDPSQQPIPQAAVSNVEGLTQMPPPANRDDRRESIRVTDLMDSFNKMKTKEFDSQYESIDTMGTSISRNNESTETMGTIEPLSIGSGGRDSFALSMSSGNFSGLLKGTLHESSRNSESALLKGVSGDPNVDPALFHGGTARLRRDSNRQSINIEDKDFFRKTATKMGASASDFSSNMSMSFSQVWNQKSPANLGNVTEEDENQDDSEKKLPGGPRQVLLMDDDPDNMSGLGKSSMSILNVAMGESQGESIMTANESIFSDV